MNELTARTERKVRRFLRRRAQIAVADRERPEYLQSYGFRPDVIVDVGVDNGTPLLYKAFPDCKFILIDPRSEAEEKTLKRHELQDYDFYACAAGAEDGQLELRIPVAPEGQKTAMAGFRKITSYLGHNIDDFDLRMVPVRPLDSIMADHPGRVGLKIDTEGFELEVLLGAVETLKRCAFVIVELSITKRFEGIAPPSAVIAELARSGLELRDIIRTPGDGRGGPHPRLFDAVFARWDAV